MNTQSSGASWSGSSNLRVLKEVLSFIDRFDPNKYSPVDIGGIEVQLHRLKALGRDATMSSYLTPDIADSIVEKFILPNISERTTNEGLTIIANGLVLNTSLLVSWDPSKAFPLVLTEYSKPNHSIKETYLLGRLLFLFTYNGEPLSDSLLTKSIEIIDQKMDKVVDNVHALTSTVALNTMLRLAFIELLKFIFNLVHFYPDRAIEPMQDKVMGKISDVFLHIKEDSCNVDITKYIFNVLLCVSVTSWFDNPQHQPLILSNILEYCQVVTNPTHLEFHNENTISPSLTCLNMALAYVWDTLPDSSPETQALKDIAIKYLYPTEKDRQLGVGKSDSLASRLVQLSSDISLGSLNRLCLEVYWVVCNRNQQTLTEVMGFGFAASFLANSFLSDSAKDPTPPTFTDPKIKEGNGSSGSLVSDTTSVLSDSNAATSASTSANASNTSTNTTTPAINPITGQYINAENQEEKRLKAQQEWDAMSEEEKEREGERMFTLFERLKQNGIIKVSNPVELAASAKQKKS